MNHFGARLGTLKTADRHTGSNAASREKELREYNEGECRATSLAIADPLLRIAQHCED